MDIKKYIEKPDIEIGGRLFTTQKVKSPALKARSLFLKYRIEEIKKMFEQKKITKAVWEEVLKICGSE